LLFISSVTLAQEEDAAAPAGGEVDETAGEESKAEECEEAWEYLEFLKTSIKERLERILQETLFEPSALLEATVADAMQQTLEIRDAILERIKGIRGVGEADKIEQCDVNVRQDEFLTSARMEIMTVLLSLIEQGAATPEKLQEIGRQILQVRTNVNAEITRIIMLRETGNVIPVPRGDCNCGILPSIVEGLDNVVMDKEKATVDGDAVVVDAASEDEPAADDTAPAADGADEEEPAEGGEMSPIEGLTMTLMIIDQEISRLYNEILSAIDEEKRKTSSDELTNLKEISTQMNDVINRILQEDGNEEKIEKIVKREVASLRNNVERQLNDCKKRCPNECESCGSEKIKEIKDKLEQFKLIIEDQEEGEAKETVRNELMGMLKKANTDMTELLKKKADLDVGAELDICDKEKLDVLESVKGPMWMMVNITIFESKEILNEMIIAVEVALNDKQSQYCGSEPQRKVPTDEEDTCDFDELNKAADFISEIDEIISENLFKGTDDEARKEAMVGIIDLKSEMDDRVRAIYNAATICHEEVNQIKTVYMDQLTQCLVEMMNPRISFTTKSRAERVACVKQLRVTIEDRRGELLMREIEKRIKQQETDQEVVEENES